MRVLILINSIGGLFSFRRELLEHLLSDGAEVIISSPDGVRREDFEKMGCRFIESKIERRGVDPTKDLGLFNSYRKLIKTERPDVVLTYTVKPNVYGGIACRLANVPYISTVTGLGTTFEKESLLKKMVVFLLRVGLADASVIMFQNDFNRQIFEKLHIGRNHRTVPGSGVNLDYHCFEPYPAESSSIRLTFVGRIMRDKGIVELLEAAENIKKNHPEVQFELIGAFDGNFQNIVNEAMSKGIVSYLGKKKEMHPFYRDCWAVIMPSYHEGTCNVCLEGASTGRPLIASNVPGCKETFDEGVSGIGFEAKSASALTEAIEKFLALSYEEKAAMGLAGRKKMEREYDRNIVINAYLEEINNISRS